MKALSILILLTVLFVSDYALAQPCPCDTAQLTNGITGDEIVGILCPGGEITPGNLWSLNPGVVAISGFIVDDVYAAYQVFSDPILQCEVTDFVNKPVFVSLTDREVEACRARLIRGCKLTGSSIPTLGEWGMIAMAGVLGVIGLFVAVRRRKVVA